MIKVLFVCHGNICRSPMAQYVFQDIVTKAGLSKYFQIDSAATSTEEIGNSVYPPAVKMLNMHGIKNINHKARQIDKYDYKQFSLIKVMDNNNLSNILHMTDYDPDGKISLLLKNENIEDPWYSGNFLKVFNLIEKGCKNLFNDVLNYKGFSLSTETDKKVFSIYCALFDLWSRKTCATRMQNKWTALNRTLGQCSVTSFLVQDLLGGDVYGTAHEDGSIHCFNVIDNKVYDLTSAQLNKYENYDNGVLQSREVHFLKEEKYNRYLLLKSLYFNSI